MLLAVIFAVVGLMTHTSTAQSQNVTAIPPQVALSEQDQIRLALQQIAFGSEQFSLEFLQVSIWCSGWS